MEVRDAIAFVVCGLTALSCAQYADVEEPSDYYDIRLRYWVESELSSVVRGDAIVLRQIIHNDSNRMVSGCVSPHASFTVKGPKGTKSTGRTAVDMECWPGTEFRLMPGRQNQWTETMELPDVGVGRLSITGEIDVWVRGEKRAIPLRSNSHHFNLGEKRTSNNVLQLTDPACHGPGILYAKTSAAFGRVDVETSSAVETGQGRASPARS